MGNIRKVTSITVLKTPEGWRISPTFSELDGNGNIIKENERRNKVVVDSGVLEAIGVLEELSNEIIKD